MRIVVSLAFQEYYLTTASTSQQGPGSYKGLGHASSTLSASTNAIVFSPSAPALEFTLNNMVSALLLANLLLSCAILAVSTKSSAPCPLLGPDVPAPISLSTSSSIKLATSGLKKSLDAALQTSTAFGRLDPQNTSFSIDFYSIHDTASLFSYHHSAPGLAKPKQGVSTVDSDTIYRMGSVSKLITMYLYLVEAGDTSFNDPITKYVPELAAYAAENAAGVGVDAIGVFDWDAITVGALASHLAGVPRDAAPGPAQNQLIAKLTGLAPANTQNVSFCGDPSVVQIPCDRAAFWPDYLSRTPVVAPFSATPIYSNGAFQILSYALENITSQSFTSLFDKLLERLGTTSTSYGLPKTTKDSIIPVSASASWYSVNLLDETVAGGYFSSLNDLKRLGTSILNSTILSSVQTRKWMKPTSFTSDADISVGAPWEIVRAPGERTSFVYTKSGDIGLYSGIVAMLPDYDVGFTVLAAGEAAHSNVEIISDIVGQALYPALESAAKAEAKTAYSGTYAILGSSKSSMTIETDKGPGLSVTKWNHEGIDVLPVLAELAGSMIKSDDQLSLRLYPTGLKNTEAGKITATAWRASFQVIPYALDPGAFSQNCATWISVDNIVNGVFSLDEFVFELDGSGKARSIEPRFLQGIAYAKSKAQSSRMMRMMRA